MIDFKSEPWPKISPAAKDLVALLLQQDTSARASTGAILRHEWLIKEGMAPDAPLDSVVLKRMRQFAQMNKLKKAALMVVGQNLSEDELQGGWPTCCGYCTAAMTLFSRQWHECRYWVERSCKHRYPGAGFQCWQVPADAHWLVYPFSVAVCA